MRKFRENYFYIYLKFRARVYLFVTMMEILKAIYFTLKFIFLQFSILLFTHIFYHFISNNFFNTYSNIAIV